MCYEQRFFSEGAKKKTSTRAEPTAIAERQRRDARPDWRDDRDMLDP